MKIYFCVLILIVFTGCSLQDSINNDFRTDSKIHSMAKANSLSDTHGDGKYVKFKVKVPLTEASLSYYDIEEILGHEQLDSRKKEKIGNLFDSLKLSLFNLFIKMGRSNSVKISSFLRFPKIDSNYIKGAYVKKVFFTTEDCRDTDVNCNEVENSQSDFKLLDKVIVNVSGHKDLKKAEAQIEEISKKEFGKLHKKIVNQRKLSRDEILKQNFTEQIYKDVNLVYLDNRVVALNSSLNGIEFHEKSQGKLLLKARGDEKEIIKYLNSDVFSKIIENAEFYEEYRYQGVSSLKKKRIGVLIDLKSGASLKDLKNKISSEEPSFKRKMLILRLNDNFVAAKRFIKSKRFDSMVKEATIIGRSLYVELKNQKSVNLLRTALENAQGHDFDRSSIYKVDTCSRSNCLDLEVNNVNLAKILEKSENVKIDTFLKVRNLKKSDFKYNGYLEIELLLDLPI